MRKAAYLMLGVSALAVAGCSQLPGASLGETFTAESYLNASHGGEGSFNDALAKEYTEVARRAAFKDVLWMNATAYIAKAKAAEAGNTPAPWRPEELGVSVPADAGGSDLNLTYDEIVRIINENRDQRPAACARVQAMWDQYLEALRGGPKFCIAPEDALALLKEAVNACRPAVQTNFVVYFGFDKADLTQQALEVIDQVVQAVRQLGATALSVVGHADTVGTVEYNQVLSERRARNVAKALIERGIPPEAITVAGRSELEPAVPTGDEVREPLNRRVEITLSR